MAPPRFLLWFVWWHWQRWIIFQRLSRTGDSFKTCLNPPESNQTFLFDLSEKQHQKNLQNSANTKYPEQVIFRNHCCDTDSVVIAIGKLLMFFYLNNLPPMASPPALDQWHSKIIGSRVYFLNLLQPLFWVRNSRVLCESDFKFFWNSTKRKNARHSSSTSVSFQIAEKPNFDHNRFQRWCNTICSYHRWK